MLLSTYLFENGCDTAEFGLFLDSIRRLNQPENLKRGKMSYPWNELDG